MAVPKTDSKYNAIGRSVNCYFCNEFFQQKYFQGHLMQCGSILEPCPKKCGVYVQRMNKNKHIAECQPRPRPTRPSSTYDLISSDNLKTTPNLSPNNTITRKVDHELNALKIALELEKRSKSELQNELTQLQNLHMKYLQHNNQLNIALENLKRKWYEEEETRKTLTHKTKTELDQIYSNYKFIEQWKTGIECDMQQIKYQVQENNNKISNLKLELKDNENYVKTIELIKQDNVLLKKIVEDEQIKWHLEFMSFVEKLNKFQDFFQEENTVIASLWSDQNKEILAIKETIESNKNLLSDYYTKYHALKFDTKNIQQITADVTDKIECQKKEIEELKKSFTQLKIDVDSANKILEDKSAMNTSNYGHLIWRINNFQEKLENAKENDVVLNSPVFYSRKYGYKLKLQVFLNGIGKWKGRHIISSLKVIKGDWDPLLQWPCNIEAKVSLKDLTKNKDYTKGIVAKRQIPDEENEDPHESSVQYIFFVKNEIIDKEKYLKDNQIFIEIKIINDNI